MTSLKESLAGLRREFHVVRKELSRLTSAVQKLERETDQIGALRVAERDVDARIGALERILNVERVSAHVHAAVAQARLMQSPVPHMLVEGLLPPDVYGAVIDATPSRVFFDASVEHAGEFRVPLRLAPTHAIVTTMFLNEVVLRSLSPLLLQRFDEPLAAFTRARFPTLPRFGEWGVEVTLSQARIVLRSPGYTGAVAVDRPWGFLTGVLYLARPHDTEQFGSCLHPTLIPFRGNAALIFLAPADAHRYEPIPQTAPAGTERYTYEFGIGPTREGRRRLAEMMKAQDARG